MNTNGTTTPSWLSLMYSTGALLLFCGIPACIIIGFGLGMAAHAGVRNSFVTGILMALTSGILGFTLLRVAERLDKNPKVTQRKKKNGQNMS